MTDADVPAPPRPPAVAPGLPAGLHAAQDYERLAAATLDARTLAHIDGGSGDEAALRANRAAFGEWSIFPRLLCDVSGGHTRVQLGGTALAHPLLLAPVAHQRLVHVQAECETARAAAATGTCLIASTLSSCTIEAIAQAADGPRWFQLYLQPRREASLGLLRRAEAAGCQAIVLTLDVPVQPQGLRSLRAGFRMPDDCVAGNLSGEPPLRLPALAPGDSRILQGLMRLAPTWDDLDWLQRQTTLPVWVKGVLHEDDARHLRARGVAGLVVSNHGGRALEDAPATLRVLPSIRQAVGTGFPLVLDGGVRSGGDAFKALALGADAVAIGRLQLHALAVAGALGVAHLMKLLREELELCMSLAGCATLAHVRAACLLPAPAARPNDRRDPDADHD